MQLAEFIPLKAKGESRVLLASVAIPAGEPVNVCTELEEIDLNELITGGRDGVFLARAIGDSMENDIKHGDFLVVNQNLSAKSGDIILALVDGKYTIKEFQPKKNGLYLVPKNKNYQPTKITPQDNFEVVGIITDVLHRLKKF